MDDRGYPPDPRRDPRAGNVDEMLDHYIEELGSPQQQYTGPTRPDFRGGDPRIDPRGRPDPRFNNNNVNNNPRAPPFSDTAPSQDQYIPLDRRQLAAQVGLPGPPPPGLLPRSQTAPGISDLDRGVQQLDLRRQSPPQQPSRSPNKLHKSPGKPAGPVGVQSQTITTSNGNQIDPNALPVFPSPDQKRTSQGTGNGGSASERGSYSSEGSYSMRPPRVVTEKPRLTLALLDVYRHDARDNPNDAMIQLDYAKALIEASQVLAQEIGMGDPKRVAKTRENFNLEAYKLVKKLASSVYTQPTLL